MPGANHYRIFWFQNGNWEFKAWTPGTSVHFTGLTPNTQYFFGVRAVDANGRESAGSPYRAVWTLANVQPPAAPGWVNSSNVQQTTLTLSWGAAAGATHYFLYWRPNANHSWTDLGWVTGTSFPISNLAANSWNEFAVRGWNSSGLGAWSPVHGVRMGSTVPVPEPPGAPRDLNSTDRTHNSATLRWNAPNTGGPVARYHVYRVVGSTNTRIATTTNTAWPLSGLAASTSYSYFVVAEGSGFLSARSNTHTFTTLATPLTEADIPNFPLQPGPAPPTLTLFLYHRHENNVHFLWHPVPNATNYHVYLNNNFLGTTSSTGIIITNLRTYLQHQTFHIVAVNANGNRIVQSNTESINVIWFLESINNTTIFPTLISLPPGTIVAPPPPGAQRQTITERTTNTRMPVWLMEEGIGLVVFHASIGLSEEFYHVGSNNISTSRYLWYHIWTFDNRPRDLSSYFAHSGGIVHYNSNGNRVRSPIMTHRDTIRPGNLWAYVSLEGKFRYSYPRNQGFYSEADMGIFPLGLGFWNTRQLRINFP